MVSHFRREQIDVIIKGVIINLFKHSGNLKLLPHFLYVLLSPFKYHSFLPLQSIFLPLSFCFPICTLPTASSTSSCMHPSSEYRNYFQPPHSVNHVYHLMLLRTNDGIFCDVQHSAKKVWWSTRQCTLEKKNKKPALKMTWECIQADLAESTVHN